MANRCSDKIHNLLACYRASSPDCKVLVVLDADIEPHPLLLQRLVTPLADDGVGAVTGYRWLVANERSLVRTVATMANAASAVSFWLSQNVWGGTLAIRKDTFVGLGVASVWRDALSDDLTLRRLLLTHGRRVVSISDGLAVSHQNYDWPGYWEFLIRQLRIARVYTPSLWWQVVAFYVLTVPTALYGVLGSAGWTVGLWSTVVPLAASPIALLFLLQGWLVIDGAQRAIRRRGEAMPLVRLRDMPIYWLALVVGCAQLVASATGRSIVWRGILYRMHARNRTEVIRPGSEHARPLRRRAQRYQHTLRSAL
jgi:cellulose synthase/poly-beta-1,6-N-acetylglucosamine synthase-like glycosyltransferase